MRLTLFFLLYGAVQFYCAHKTSRGMGLTGVGRWLAYLFALTMTFGPLLVWQVERLETYQQVAVYAAWAVYGWMGFSFLFFSVGLLFDAYAGVARLGSLPRLEPAGVFIVLTLLAAGLWIMGFHSAWTPRVEHIVIRSEKIPAKSDGLRIVQISDVHLGVLIRQKRLDEILSRVRALNPDILVSTGDLVDAQAHHLNGLSDKIADFEPRLGKFAINGNHESYVGLEHAQAFHERAGFKMLRGSHAEVAGIVLAGVDDPAVFNPHWSGREPAAPPELNEPAMLRRIDPDRFIVLLKHQPRIDPGSRFDLQLSGHTHAGQIYPFRHLVRLVYPMIEGLHALNNGGRLYVNRGTGTWGPPIRVFAPPEITLIELRSR